MNDKFKEMYKGTISILDNAYRTKNYLVVQHIEIKHDKEENTVLCSYDTFYKRTPEREKNYKKNLQKPPEFGRKAYSDSNEYSYLRRVKQFQSPTLPIIQHFGNIK